MSLLTALFFASLALASQDTSSLKRLLRRNLFFGGSESRFIMGPPVSIFDKPKLALGVDWPYNYGQQVILKERNDDDRYQKFRIQDTDQGAYLRFDNHPQPGIRTRDGDNKIEMYNAGWDAHGEWMIIVVAIWQNNQFVEPEEELVWDANTMSEIGRLRVTVWNKAKNAFLRVNEAGEPEMLAIDIEADEDKLNDHDWVRSQRLNWEINYVTSAWSAGEVALAVLAPTGVVAALAAAFLAPAAAAAIFATFGFASIPAMQAIGAAAASTYALAKVTVASAIIWQATIEIVF